MSSIRNPFLSTTAVIHLLIAAAWLVAMVGVVFGLIPVQEVIDFVDREELVKNYGAAMYASLIGLSILLTVGVIGSIAVLAGRRWGWSVALGTAITTGLGCILLLSFLSLFALPGLREWQEGPRGGSTQTTRRYKVVDQRGVLLERVQVTETRPTLFSTTNEAGLQALTITKTGIGVAIVLTLHSLLTVASLFPPKRAVRAKAASV